MKISELLIEKYGIGTSRLSGPPHPIEQMMDDPSVQQLLSGIYAAREQGMSWLNIKANLGQYEAKAGTKLNDHERKALYQGLVDGQFDRYFKTKF